MKKHLKKAYLLLALLLTLASCGEDRTHEYLEQTEENQWIYETMKEVYLWKENIKKPGHSQFFTPSSKFFTSLLYSDDKASFFTDTVSSGDYGMTFTLMRDPIAQRPSRVYALVLFAEPNSPAAKAGIGRGTWISEVGNKKLTMSNGNLLLSGAGTDIVTEYIDYDDEAGEYFWEIDDTITIAAAANYGKCDILMDSIYTVRDRNVGYFVINNFGNESFIDKCDMILERFIAENTTDVIVDLRYCSGGSLDNAAALASSLVPASLAESPFAVLENSEGEIDTTYNFTERPFNIGEKRIFFITGQSTTGTAELLVASVNLAHDTYDVMTLGDATAGSNVVVERIESPFGFVINPSTAYACTADGKRLGTEGIKPDYQISELAAIEHVYPLGNEQEQMLYNAMYLIANGTVPAGTQQRTHCISIPPGTAFTR